MDYRRRNYAVIFIMIMIINTLMPIPGYALSGGNKAPEFESFQPFGLDNMVDPATGDFSYNIPLMNVGFHGVNLFYQAGITMDQEASMVGLGWNINSGVINRTVRGIPDDFNGEEIVKEQYVKPNRTWGLTVGGELEIAGTEILDIGGALNVFYNNYNGLGFDYSFPAPEIAANIPNGNEIIGKIGLNTSFSIGNQNASVSPTLSFRKKIKDTDEYEKEPIAKAGWSINSKVGLAGMNLAVNHGLRLSKLSIPSYVTSFSKPSFVPSSPWLTSSSSFSVTLTGPFSGFLSHAGSSLKGYYSKQGQNINSMSLKSFGAYYFDSGIDRRYQYLNDISRTNDLPITEALTNLPVPILNKDIYSTVGPGTAGNFNLERGDYGLYYDGRFNSFSGGAAIEIEGGGGAVAHLGAKGTGQFGTNFISSWEANHNDLSHSLSINNDNTNTPEFEPRAFVMSNELNCEKISESNFVKFGNELAVEAKLKFKNVHKYKIVNELESTNPITSYPINSNSVQKRQNRIKRNNKIVKRTFRELIHTGSKFNFNESFNNFTSQPVPNNYSVQEKFYDQVGSFEVVNENGDRYIYGIPVFNLNQQETTFEFKFDQSTSSESQSCELGIATYDPIILNQKKGDGDSKSEYYYNQQLPPHVSSYLLTHIVSSDYVDRAGDGPTEDDFGNYVKYNYVKKDDYNWRTPLTNNVNQGLHNKGLQTINNDDKINFTFGKREQYYIHSIEDKTTIAEFHYYPDGRLDNLMAKGPQGGVNENPNSWALEKIVKYSKLDDEKNSPLKSVFFEYDYSLCKNVPNSIANEKGKLTLRKLYVLNGLSNKGRFSPYEFNYGFNPDYQPKAKTRWGSYYPLDIYSYDNNLDKCSQAIDSELSIHEFPYVPQFNFSNPSENITEHKNKIDLFASAWNLNKVKLPSGGEIDIEYESDDYAYVQDLPAMNMLPIIATSITKKNSINSESNSTLFERNNGDTDNYNYIYIDLGKNRVTEDVEASSSEIEQKAKFKKYYLKDMEDNYIYFKVLGKVGKGTISDPDYYIDNYEYLPTWVKIEDYGVVPNNPYVGYLKLKSSCLGDKEEACSIADRIINPISKGLMQFAKIHLSKSIYENNVVMSDSEEDSEIIENIKSLLNVTTQIEIFLTGINRFLRNKEVGSKIINKKSFVRLYNPLEKKLSGTHRVAKISMNNRWSSMAGSQHQNNIIGKKYEYANNMNESSYGVAAFEPVIGGEENPLYQPIKFTVDNFMAPDDKTTITTPLMSSYYPAPNIIYGKVTVRDIIDQSLNDNIEPTLYTNSGYQEYEFYTSKDFPIKSFETDLDPKIRHLPSVLNLLRVKSKVSAHATQGYTFINPLMHGKQKSTRVFNSSDKLISGSKIFYKTKNNGSLNNEVKALYTSQNIEDSYLGLNFEIIGDLRKALETSSSGGVSGNLDIAGVPPFVGFTITGIPSFSMEEKVFRSIVLVKNITQHGIIDRVETYNGNSTISTKNLLWDAETGQPILTETRNEFEDPIFNLNLPAHLAYKNMGQAYQNTGATFSDVLISNGDIVDAPPNFAETLTEGDKLAFYNSQDSDPSIDLYQFGWVLKAGQNAIKIIDKSGQLFNTGNIKYVKILESGYENKAGAAIASYTMRENPIEGDKLVIDESKKILQASTTVYSDRWQTICGRDANNVNNQNSNEGNSSGQSQAGNLIYNGDFENGNIGFTSDYDQSDNIANGGYNIVNNQDANFYEEVCQCNLGASYGNVLLANNNGYDGYYDLFCQDVNLQAGEEYKFSFDRLNYCPCVTRGLRLKVNGSILKEFDLALQLKECLWYNNEFSFVAPNSGQSQICLEHVNDIQTCQWPAIDNLKLLNVSESDPSRPPKPGNPQALCLPTTQDIVNPFLQNIKGNWRALKSYVFQTDRSSTDNIREDGYFVEDPTNYNNKFEDFWKINSSSNKLEPNVGNWTWTSENTMVSPFGTEVEAKDPLNRYSAELVSNANQKVVAVAANAKYNEIAYYGAEIPISNSGTSIWPFFNKEDCGIPYHTNIENGERVLYNEKILPNSGNYHLKYNPGLQTILKFDTALDDTNCGENNSVPYVVQPCDCLPIFSPTVGKKYLLSVWLNHSCLQDDTCEEQPNLKVSIGNQDFTIEEYGPLIEGWRKVEGTFTIPINATDGEVKLNIPSGVAYLDDIRIHPYNASMKTYNYDQNTLRFTFEHDDNNFYTRYDYADDGSLKRVSKQTERSLQTLQESVTSQYKQN
jgi:hypothetical protein